MERLATAYLPIDRYKAVLDNRELTPRDSGSALFVDVSGFTPLSETYSRLLGIRRGAEEISRQMNRIFEALIVWIHGYGGSVIGFSGDAMTCWFSENWPEQVHESPSARAVAAGCAMLQAVNDFAAITLPDGSQASIGIKVSVASGTAGRILAGDPAIQSFDLVVGSTIERMALGESLLKRGELIVDEKTADVLKAQSALMGDAGWKQPVMSSS